MSATPDIPIDTDQLRQKLNVQLHTEHDDEHEHDRTLARAQLVFDLFYDDDEEPDTAVRDALTDLMHVAADRGINFEQALVDASRMWSSEREEWEVDS